MTRSFDRMLDKAFHGKSVADILNASPAALQGLSASDAQRLEEVFGIRTIRDLARNRFFQRSLALLNASGETHFDPGPPVQWRDFLASAPLDYYVHHASRRFRIDFGPVYYRGRLDGTARILVVGQDPSTNEILGQRILVGSSGQRVQGFLRKLGITRSYVMANLFLFSVFGQVDAELRAIALEEPILTFRNSFFDRLAQENNLQAVVVIGKGAQLAVDNWPGSQEHPVFEIQHPAALDEAAVLATWNSALTLLRPIVEPDDDGSPDPSPYGSSFAPEDAAPIPRFDLPFGLPEWHGNGSHSHRDGNKNIVWTAP
jgi:hypothetical protein